MPKPEDKKSFTEATGHGKIPGPVYISPVSLT